MSCRALDVQHRLGEQRLAELSSSSPGRRRAREAGLSSAEPEPGTGWAGHAAPGPEATGGTVANSS